MADQMTGPEHYAEAARLLEAAQSTGTSEVDRALRTANASQVDRAYRALDGIVAMAAVHADLARTAALLEQGPISTDWAAAIGRPVTPTFPDRSV